jgi:predicted nucleotidyltransferase
MKINPPTPYPEVNAIIQELLEGIQGVLGEHLIGMYLEGSLANGDFDQDSDIDFVAVTDVEVTGDLFSSLQSMHDQIATFDSTWAIQLEGSYLSVEALRRYDPANNRHPNIERGLGERLKMVQHEEVWNVHRHILRERGITIVGPDPQTLIDPVTPNDLKHAMLPALHNWATYMLHHPSEISSQGYQSYIVLSLCRILYTLQRGEVVSKLKAAKWAKETRDPKWKSLIDHAWEGRHASQIPPDPAAIRQTQDFIEYTLEVSRNIKLT